MKQEEGREQGMEKIVSLAKRRGFVFPGSDIYGGLANSWDYGPLGVLLKRNIANAWWERFVTRRDDMVGIDAALIMNPKVWEASGHLKEFTDPLVECKKCHERFRADEIGWDFSGKDSKKLLHHWPTEKKCPSCGVQISRENFTPPRMFTTMLKTFLGPVDPLGKLSNLWTWFEDAKDRKDEEEIKKVSEEINNSISQKQEEEFYLRPETAQGIFVNFKNILDTARKRLPFGVAQIGKAFRNEITPGNFIFRTREFEQMEIEYFIPPPKSDEEWQKHFEYWREEMFDWMKKDLGLNIKDHVFELDVAEGERAHYSKKTIDFEYAFPFGQKELYGLAYRTDFDLKNHFKEPPYKDPETGEAFWPHVIEPSLGVDRTVLAVLLDAYTEEEDRIVLKLPQRLAPYKAAVFPLLANKPKLIELARKIYDSFRKDFSVAWDDRGNIGKRYYSQDEIGTPFCITADFDSLEKNDVTVRDRDTMKQERVAIDGLTSYLLEKFRR